jgi:hypothetical protein
MKPHRRIATSECKHETDQPVTIAAKIVIASLKASRSTLVSVICYPIRTATRLPLSILAWSGQQRIDPGQSARG